MAWTYPHEFHDGTGETASGVQVNDNFAKAKEKIEALEAPPSAYTARAPLSPESLTGSGTTSWTNATGKRASVHLDFELHSENLRGAIVNLYVGGVLVGNFFLRENGTDVRMGTSLVVAQGEVVLVELIGGGGVKVSGVNQSHRNF